MCFIVLPVRHFFRVAYGITNDVSDTLIEDAVFFIAINFQSSSCMVIIDLVEKCKIKVRCFCAPMNQPE